MPDAHPMPPSDFAERDLPLVQVERRLFRISRKEYATPLYFGASGDCRFDAPDASFGVCYFAFDLPGAFIEVFGRSPGTNLVTMDALEARLLAEVELSRPLNAVDLTGEGLAKIGADNRLAGGGDYAVSQGWSAAIHAHPAAVDGLLYRSRHDPSRICLAAFSRCDDVFELGSQTGLTEGRLREGLGEVFELYGFAVG